MDYYQLGKTALEARQFFEAESNFRRAIKQVSEDKFEEIYEAIYVCAKSIRPDYAWKEFEPWIREKEKKHLWGEILECISIHEEFIPINHCECLHELKVKAYLSLGQISNSKISASSHLEYLLKKKNIPRYIEFSERYKDIFSHTLIFYFHSVMASSLTQDIERVGEKIKTIFHLMNNRWNQLEDVTPTSKSTLLNELCESLEVFDRKNGTAAMLQHYCHLEKLNGSKQELKPEDWKKLVELIIYNPSWRHIKLGLNLAIKSNDEELIKEFHLHLTSKKGFSFVKFTKNDLLMKKWLLSRGHLKEHETLISSSELNGYDEDQVSYTEAIPEKENEIGIEELNDEEKVAERNAIKQISLVSPPLDIVPDLIITYKMLGFGKVVDWLIKNYRNCEDYPRIQRKIQYLSVLRDIKLKNYHFALATLEEMLGSKDMNLEELKELRYAQGAIHKSIGNKDLSNQAFLEVEKMHPGYRKLRERNG